MDSKAENQCFTIVCFSLWDPFTQFFGSAFLRLFNFVRFIYLWYFTHFFKLRFFKLLSSFLPLSFLQRSSSKDQFLLFTISLHFVHPLMLTSYLFFFHPIFFLRLFDPEKLECYGSELDSSLHNAKAYMWEADWIEFQNYLEERMLWDFFEQHRTF